MTAPTPLDHANQQRIHEMAAEIAERGEWNYLVYPLVREVPDLLATIDALREEVLRLRADAEYGAYCRAVDEAYKTSGSKVRPLEYERWIGDKDAATAWLYAVPLWQYMRDDDDATSDAEARP